MLRINGDPECQWTETITNFLIRELDAKLETSSQLLEVLTSQFVSTSQNRQGPAPKPEGLVKIREVIKEWTGRGEGIKVLVPWGSKKPVNDKSVDIAELFALKQLIALNDRVKKAYPPGLNINIGIEDLGGQYLWPGKEERISSAKYVRDMVKLVEILERPELIAKPESELVEYEKFARASDQMYGRLEPYIRMKVNDRASANLMYSAQQEINNLMLEMQEIGWKGEIEFEQIDFYLSSYRKYYPRQSTDENLRMMARYLSQSWARYKVGAKLAYPSWGEQYIQINFPQPVPGVPASLADRRLYCRTLPMYYSRNHLAPWRAKGYLEIAETGGVWPKLISFTQEKEMTEEEYKVVMSNGRETLEIGAPYRLEGMWEK